MNDPNTKQFEKDNIPICKFMMHTYPLSDINPCHKAVYSSADQNCRLTFALQTVHTTYQTRFLLWALCEQYKTGLCSKCLQTFCIYVIDCTYAFKATILVITFTQKKKNLKPLQIFDRFKGELCYNFRNWPMQCPLLNACTKITFMKK